MRGEGRRMKMGKGTGGLECRSCGRGWRMQEGVETELVCVSSKMRHIIKYISGLGLPCNLSRYLLKFL